LKAGSKKNVTGTLSDEKLREAYLEVYAKYTLQGINMPHPKNVPIFKK